MDMFNTTAVPTQTQPQPGSPGNIPAPQGSPTAQSNGTAPNGIVPAPATPTTPAPATNPLDEFSKMWEAPTNAEGKPIPPANTELFTVDHKQLMEAAGKVDFSKTLSPELLAKINAGGEGATTALLEAMNKTSQQVYAQSAIATSEIVKEAIRKSTEASEKLFADKVKNLNISESLREQNAVFSHPAAAPVLSAIQERLTIKNPGASTAEIKEMANKYLSSFADALAPKTAPVVTPGNKGATETDWSTFLG
jgi:hypothetical protein